MRVTSTLKGLSPLCNGRNLALSLEPAEGPGTVPGGEGRPSSLRGAFLADRAQEKGISGRGCS